MDPSRLRAGELIAGASAILLVAFMLLLSWYGLSGPLGATASGHGVSTSVNGWDGLSHLRWLMLLTAGAAVGLVLLQATQRAPALPVSMSVIVTVLGGLTTLALIYRVLISSPGTAKAGAYLGLASAIGIAYGGYRSIREEGIASGDARSEIETVNPERKGGS